VQEQVNVEAIEAAFLLRSAKQGVCDLGNVVKLAVCDKGFLLWSTFGRLHRVNGPAVVWCDGGEEWFHSGKRHRDNGPAIVRANGYQEWWIHGELQRTDGPVIEQANRERKRWKQEVRASVIKRWLLKRKQSKQPFSLFRSQLS
jgi:hypothetical protein